MRGTMRERAARGFCSPMDSIGRQAVHAWLHTTSRRSRALPALLPTRASLPHRHACVYTPPRGSRPPLPPTYQSSGSLHVYIPVPERRGIHPRGQNMVEHMLYISCICPRGMLRESGSGHPDSRTHPHAPAVCTRPAAVAEAPTRRRRSYFFNPCPWRYERVVQQISRA